MGVVVKGEKRTGDDIYFEMGGVYRVLVGGKAVTAALETKSE